MDGKTEVNSNRFQLQKIDRQLNEQFIHRVNDTDMLSVIITELN